MNKVIMPANEQKYAPQNGGEEEGKKKRKTSKGQEKLICVQTDRSEPPKRKINTPSEG